VAKPLWVVTPKAKPEEDKRTRRLAVAQPLRVVTPEAKPKEDKRRTTTDFGEALSGRFLGRGVVLAFRTYAHTSTISERDFVN
jgi:hypothetical protein